MFSQFIGGESAARVFTYEVKGLRQSDATENNAHAVRHSSVFINVPYARMNPEMQRIARLGGTIVSIKPYSGTVVTAQAEG
jgi:phycocyanin-associated, rod